MNNIKNIFSDIPENIPEEIFETLVRNKNIKVERIVSKGHRSPKDFWYDQEQDEWVLVLQGEAKLLFQHEKQPILLKAGDYINIPAHRKHRVEWTTPNTETVWLAIY